MDLPAFNFNDFKYDASLGGAKGLPPWVIDENFPTGQYYPRPIATELVDVRASSKFLTPATGNLAQVASNVLPISTAGMLVEPAATNLALQSQALATSPWAINFGGFGGNPAITNNSATAPDGTNTATLVVVGRTGSAGQSNIVQTFTGTAVPYVESLYIMAPTGADVGKQLTLAFYDGSAIVGATIVTLTSSWQRVSATATLTASASCQLLLGLFNGVGTGQLGTVNALVWGFQNELGSSPSSYIPTTTASAARAADAITIQRTGIGSVVFTFDDASQQTITGIGTGAQYTLPTNLNRSLITRMTGYASAFATWILTSGAWSDVNTWIDTATWNG